MSTPYIATNVEAEMPKYKCHKEVYALKIKAITTDEHDMTLICPEDEGYAEFFVDKSYIEKHKPVVGGYYVVYKDGYKSFSPTKAFEDGYTRI